jgi:hypothetical protein
MISPIFDPKTRRQAAEEYKNAQSTEIGGDLSKVIGAGRRLTVRNWMEGMEWKRKLG